MESLQGLVFSQLDMPVWQILLYIGLNSLFLLKRRTKFCLLTTCLFALYWIFHFFRAYWLSPARGDLLPLVAYILFSFILVALALYTFFFFQESHHLPGFSSYEVGRLQRTLLKRIDQMETAVLKAETRAVHEIRQFEELKQKIETRIGPLENQVHKMDEVLGQREFAVQGLEKGLLTQLHDLEQQLGKKEELLQSRDKEIQELRLEVEEKSAKLRLQEREQEISRGESSWKETKENLHAAIHDLELQLGEKEALLLARNMEIKDLRSEAEERDGALDSRLQALKAELAGRESSLQEREEKLSARIQDLENQLREREQRPQTHGGGVEALSLDVEEKIATLQLLLKEQEDSFARRAASYKEVVESLTSRINDLENQLKERESLANVPNGETRRKRGKGSQPKEEPRESAPNLPDGMEAELEKIRAGLREGEKPLRPQQRSPK